MARKSTGRRLGGLLGPVDGRTGMEKMCFDAAKKEFKCLILFFCRHLRLGIVKPAIKKHGLLSAR